MEQMNQVEATGEVEESEEHIHLPPPSWAPVILALGMTGVCFGVVLSPVLLAIGGVLLFAGLGVWVYEEIKNASQADAEDHASQHAS